MPIEMAIVISQNLMSDSWAPRRRSIRRDNRVQILSYGDNMNTSEDSRTVFDLSPQRQAGTKEKAGCPSKTTGLPNRGNKTAIELFVAGTKGWESGLQRRLNDAKPITT
jgi:hypothetical protein